MRIRPAQRPGAWFRGGGNRWAVTQRNADAALIRDANAELVLGAEDDPELDTFSDLSTERLLRDATDADCWMIRDPLIKRIEFDEAKRAETIEARGLNMARAADVFAGRDADRRGRPARLR